MESEHTTVAETEQGQVTVRVYGDGDVVVCHGERGTCRHMRGVSGYGPILNACVMLELPTDIEDEIIDFVHGQTDLIEA